MVPSGRDMGFVPRKPDCAACRQYSYVWCHFADPEVGGQGSRPTPPLRNHKGMGFLSKNGPDPLSNHKGTKTAFNVGHHRPASETPFKWRFAGGPMMNGVSLAGRWCPAFSVISILSPPLIN